MWTSTYAKRMIPVTAMSAFLPDGAPPERAEAGGRRTGAAVRGFAAAAMLRTLARLRPRTRGGASNAPARGHASTWRRDLA